MDEIICVAKYLFRGIRTAELISDHLGWEIVIFTARARDKVI
jgi:hypothetical protein